MAKKQTRKVNLPMMQIRAEFKPESFNEKDRTIDVTWSVGSKGLRSGWDGSYYEALSMDPKSVRMDRLQSGNAPFLDAHNSWSSSAVLGVVQSAQITDGVGTATIRLVDPADVDNVDTKDTLRKIQAGFLRNISVGYNVYTYERQPMADDEEIPTYLATDWEPMELSSVPIGFDQDAEVRSQKRAERPCKVIDNFPEEGNEEVRDMSTKVKTEVEQPASASATQVDIEADKKRAADEAAAAAKAAEKARHAEIKSIAKRCALDDQFVQTMVDQDKTIEQVRAAAIDAIAERSKTSDIKSGTTITGGAPSHQVERAQGIENSILVRAGTLKEAELTSAGRQFRGMSLLRIAEECLVGEGKDVRGLGPMELTKRAMEGTSDFLNILANVLNKTLRKPYEESPRTYDPLVRVVEVNDFKPISRTQLSGAPSLELVGESGEIKRGALTDAAENYSVQTYAKTVAITRKAIINDDLSAFTRVPMAFGAAAVRKELDVVWGLLQTNALMGDGYALFQASKHKNYVAQGSGGAPSTGASGTLAAMRGAFRRQVGLAGELLNLIPKYVMVGSYLEETIMEILKAEILATQVSNTNTFKGAMLPIVEPRIDNISQTAWFGSVDISQNDIIELAYLTGQRGIYTEQRLGWDVDGLEVKARLDVGAKVIDWRSLYYNYGA